VDGGREQLESLIADGPVLLVFVHADCPTSTLALRHLATVSEGDARPVVVAEESREQAARLARIAGARLTVLAADAPYDVSAAYGVRTVPTAVLVDGSGAVCDEIVGWSRSDYERLLGVTLPAVGPAFKPGCGSRLAQPPVEGG